MSKRKKKRTLAVRVEYEPSRLSQEYLQRTYEALDSGMTSSPNTSSKENPTESRQEPDQESSQAPGGDK